MKPVKLKLTAFGPYRDSEEINFEDLEGNRLFVISGSTGAGKTSIFDGICFALYGSASGSDRSEPKNLRSDFAKDSVHTSAELTFEVHGTTYRILRQMSHVKKGNKSATGERYEFFEMTDAGENPCVERQIVSELNRRIEEILGLTFSQFNQIVMLPQGEFRKLLTSETDNKEAILRKIFRTEPYRLVAERLKQKKDEAQERFKAQQMLYKEQVQAIAGSLPQRESALFEVFAQGDFQRSQLLAGLEGEISHYETESIGLQERYQQSYDFHNKKMAEFHEAKGWNGRFDELEAKKRHLQELEQQLPKVKEWEQQVIAADQAGMITGLEEQVMDLVANERQKREELLRAETAEQKAQEMNRQAQQVKDEEENRHEQRQAAQQALIRLHDMEAGVKELEQQRTAVQQLEKAAIHARTALQRTDEQAASAEQQLTQTKSFIQQLEERLEHFDDKRDRQNRLAEQQRVLAEYLRLDQKLEGLAEQSTVDQAKFEQAHKAYQTMEHDWFANQAALLGSNLHEGEACPVCGSLEHPAKQLGSSAAVNQQAMEQAKQVLAQSEQKFRKTEAEEGAVREQVALKREELDGMSIAAEQASAQLETVRAEQHSLTGELEQLQSDKEQLRKRKVTFVEMEDQLLRLKKQQAEAQHSAHEKRSAHESAQAVLESKLTSIPEALRDLGSLRTETAKAQETKDRLEAAWQQAQDALQKAERQLSEAAVSLRHSKQSVQELQEKLEHAESRFEEALVKSAFATKEAYQEAKLEASRYEELKTQIEQYKQDRHTTERQMAELESALAGRGRVDVSDVEQALAELKADYERALSELNTSKEYKKKAQAFFDEVSDASAKEAAAEAEFARIVDLYDTIRGQNDVKLSFERYLQIEYLEQILEAANERLKHLSNGQFHLTRSDRQEARGKQSGLGLDVYDAYTGQTRDVKTMSGGEKFNASLCLALGMADVIQSFEGNVSIETMFIDEGFGSLDEGSLNKAIETLVDLQKSGRMIGVISHVQELKAAIPAILEVEKTKEGISRTRFQLK
ncbi:MULTISPECIES: SbcC/MukB-like Walker B domain-containing protein [unclassified Planococcus (in: firmicutes)]|uniref:SbcC/MukB-like Walker B domain-containing protein n=1 Tax=unclassified Planococcus (in: firmicutes) TaxID=2662419 RepID=UPI000C338A54|nr:MULTISPECIES: SMC family ATPase [unclassified Planococcus (in: firmicutes)]AUD12817.1 exonuclease [Planococcus sp. MB-3u-03]PKG47436.1 exonuclease [Planococcus sp. Urea-trap-24]PKG88240.1 exonuclease [Planococcus sp. Urea-3u-39]PKH36835.1 exonuclease [Planococcus sp. MB-3u-09]